MSLFSRFFRKTTPPSPSAAASPAPSKSADKTQPRPDAAERARAAAAEEAALQSAIDAGDTQAVARLVVAGTSTQVRQKAAQAIDDLELLRKLIRDVRGGNDNKVYKLLTAKRDALLEQARAAEQLQAEILAASAALQRHSLRAYDALFAARLEQVEERWQAVAAQADAALRDQAQHWLALARETLATHLRHEAEKAAQQQAMAEQAAEAQRLRQQQAEAAAALAAEQARVLDEQKRAQAEQPRHEQAAESPRSTDELGGLLRKALEALNEGSSTRAKALRRSMDDKLAAAQPLPAPLASQLLQLDRQLAELQDWQRFSVAPKRAELIEEMESLIGAALDPQALADLIKGLQDQWRQLSKGSGDNQERDWQRFHDAAQKAYQPCSEYFAAQAAVREQNLQQREALIDQLTAFAAAHDWQQPDWRAVSKQLFDTQQQWRRHSAVNRQAGKQQQERYLAAVANLQGRLDAEHARNVAQKQALIERAQQLLASSDGRKAIDTAKDLQQQWRNVGPVPREADQRLWAEFRQHCDAVFQKRQQEFASQTAELDRNKEQAIALCEQVEQIAALQGAELLERTRTLGDLRKAFAELGDFPRADARALQSRFERGLERCGQSLAAQRLRDSEQGWSDLFAAADRVRAYQLAVVRGEGAESLQVLKQTAEDELASARDWPKGGLDALRRALAAEPAGDLAANEAALKLLCVRAEVLGDTPTPPEDQALRRDYQLQRLVQNMGQGAKADEAQWQTLAIEWLGVGPVDAARYQPLLQRFRSSRAANA